MRDLFFVMRMLIITFTLILTMQIQINNKTIEERSLAWIRTSPYIEELQKIADAGVVGARKLWGNITSKFSDGVFKGFKSEDRPGNRLKASWERSKSFIEEKSREAKEKVQKLRENHQEDN
ncbi:MAG: hypothetical protein A4S09_10620 [Proteobacteria bacterium SG_bin7]|nr:MAG: hypothetical protein A4S09_10620 [Proteobacteria bacterium SG_bin7]